MKKIRRGNDFVFAWEIERNGLPENLSSVLEKHLYLSALGKRVELVEGVDYDISGNVVRIEVTPTIANILGTYKAEFHYILPDNGLIDEDRKCAVDVDAFVIVNSTAQADNPSEFTVTSDMAIAFKGDKGDPLTYDDLTPEQKAELQQPATDAIASIQEVELAVETAEGLRVQAELNRQTNTSTAILNAEQATDDANDAAILANEKADLANNAAILANEKAGLAATATTQANAARDEANSAAQTATNLVNTYATDLAAKELKANKQNSLEVDGTGTKFPTVDAVNAGLQPKLVSGTNIKTVNGQSLLGSGDIDPKLAYEYTVSGNKEVVVESIDYATNTITAKNHGLENGNWVNAVINTGLLEYAFSVLPFIQSNGVYVISASANTFQVSLTIGGAVLTLNNTITDFSKFKIQRVGPLHMTLTEIVGIENGFRCVINGGNLVGGPGAYYYIGYEPTQSSDANYLRSHGDVATATFGRINLLIGIQATQYFNYEFTLINSVNGIGITTKTISFESNNANSYNIKNKYGCAYLNQQQKTNLNQVHIGNASYTNGTTIKIYRL